MRSTSFGKTRFAGCSAALLCLLSACGDDSPSADAGTDGAQTGQEDGGFVAKDGADAGSGSSAAEDASSGSSPASTDAASESDAEDLYYDGAVAVFDEVIPKSACVLLTASDVAAAAGYATMPSTESSGGQQCGWQASDPMLIDRSCSLEETPNGRAIFDATRDFYASSGLKDMLIEGLGDRAEFRYGDETGSDMMALKGDILLRLSMTFVPDRSSDEQLAALRTLMAQALTRL